MLNTDQVQKLVLWLDHLEARWQDEKDYEPWSDYVADAHRKVEKIGGTSVVLNRKPFILYFVHGHVRYEFRVTKKGVYVMQNDVAFGHEYQGKAMVS